MVLFRLFIFQPTPRASYEVLTSPGPWQISGAATPLTAAAKTVVWIDIRARVQVFDVWVVDPTQCPKGIRTCPRESFQQPRASAIRLPEYKKHAFMLLMLDEGLSDGLATCLSLHEADAPLGEGHQLLHTRELKQQVLSQASPKGVPSIG